MDATQTPIELATLAELTKRKTELEHELQRLRAEYKAHADAIQKQADQIDEQFSAVKAGVK